MQSNDFFLNDQVYSSLSCSLKKFCSSFNVATTLNRCRIRKASDAAAKDILFALFSSPFLGKYLFHVVIENKNVPFGKDAVYEFLKCETFNWRKLILCLAVQIISFFETLTSNLNEMEGNFTVIDLKRIRIRKIRS